MLPNTYDIFDAESLKPKDIERFVLKIIVKRKSCNSEKKHELGFRYVHTKLKSGQGYMQIDVGELQKTLLAVQKLSGNLETILFQTHVDYFYVLLLKPGAAKT